MTQMLMMKKMTQNVGDELSEHILSHVSHSHRSVVMKLMRNEKSLLVPACLSSVMRVQMMQMMGNIGNLL